ncbi:hypothetical protein C475_21859 [Halosimplex carlsbadense 2-9-1]|uniref:Halobacterial output domain-containing protein n=1 Tax=Halosimplex carlsbadense 2-9-1 TaxID=797114 RepID=M0CBJ8_9EURY|nr:hypothetical protein C475_21859 [Halosimplex carlsbadense 2-9-1]
MVSILEAVANAERTNSVDLPPLSGAVDPEALNALVDSGEDECAPLRVTLTYAGYEITIDRDGDVDVVPVGPSSGVSPPVARADGPLAE